MVELTEYSRLVYRLFIGGEWVDPIEGGSVECVLPSSSHCFVFFYSEFSKVSLTLVTFSSPYFFLSII